MSGVSRIKAMTIGVVMVIVAVIVAAFALGGNNNSLPVHRGTPYPVTGSGDVGSSIGATEPYAVPTPVPSAPGDYAAGGGAKSSSVTGTAGRLAPVRSNGSASVNDAVASTGGVDATRVVKTGSLSLAVHKGLVATTIVKLTDAAKSLGGYVSSSRTNDVDGSPTGTLTFRIPVNNFDAAVSAAAKLGKQTSLNTNADDVTGKFVDVNARLSALKRTRSTYLTILGQARTIGQTLSVQQRVNDIQQQVEQLQGELKVLRNQSSDGTLTVDVSELGTPAATVAHHHRSGWSKAWHTSTGRFNHGLQTIIGGLGALLLALLLFGLVFVVALLSTRRLRRATS